MKEKNETLEEIDRILKDKNLINPAVSGVRLYDLGNNIYKIVYFQEYEKIEGELYIDNINDVVRIIEYYQIEKAKYEARAKSNALGCDFEAQLNAREYQQKTFNLITSLAAHSFKKSLFKALLGKRKVKNG